VKNKVSPRKEEDMPVPKANQKAVNKYVKANYDRINVTMPKGKKETIQAAAAAAGESVNAYINGAIDNQMKRDIEGGEEGGN
jgi:hypothetical protein